MIGSLELCLREAQRRREVIASLEDEDHTLSVGLRSAMEYAEQLEDLECPLASETHLRVVPGDDGTPQPEAEPGHADTSEPKATSTTTQTGAPSAASHTESHSASPAADAPSTDKIVVVRGARMKQILSVVGSRPETLWASSDIADLLDIASSDRSARRALRTNLAALTERGALERIPLKGDNRVVYKPLMNWSFV